MKNFGRVLGGFKEVRFFSAREMVQSSSGYQATIVRILRLRRGVLEMEVEVGELFVFGSLSLTDAARESGGVSKGSRKSSFDLLMIDVFGFDELVFVVAGGLLEICRVEGPYEACRSRMDVEGHRERLSAEEAFSFDSSCRFV